MEIEFEKVELTSTPRKLNAKWTIEMEQDINVMNNASLFGEPEGVKIFPPNNDETRYVWQYKVIGEEQENGHIKIVKDETEKKKEGKIVTREKFEELYFEEAL